MGESWLLQVRSFHIWILNYYKADLLFSDHFLILVDQVYQQQIYQGTLSRNTYYEGGSLVWTDYFSICKTLIYYIVQIMTYSYKDVQGKQKASETEQGDNLI